MTKNLRTAKVCIVMGILLISVFVSLVPSTSARLLTSTVDVKMEYDASAASNNIIPLVDQLIIPINISTQIQGVFAKLYERILEGRTSASVDLSVGQTPSWASAMISPNVVTPDISSTWGAPQQAYVYISFDETAPANMPLVIEIQMHAYVPGSLGLIQDATKSADIQFTPAFLPIIDATPKSTYKEINPGDIVTFDIDLENLGNAETEFLFSVVSVPDGWSASIISNTKVGSRVDGKDPTKTVQLFVQPPYGFGYHNERKDIKITAQGRYFAGGTALETESYEIIFTVRSRGFSTPGFEAAFALFVLVGVALVVKKLKKKN